MSVYYYVACRHCKVVVPFFGIWAGGTAHLDDESPAEMLDHIGHLEELFVVDEHSEYLDKWKCKWRSDEPEEKDEGESVISLDVIAVYMAKNQELVTRNKELLKENTRLYGQWTELVGKLKEYRTCNGYDIVDELRREMLEGARVYLNKTENLWFAVPIRDEDLLP